MNPTFRSLRNVGLASCAAIALLCDRAEGTGPQLATAAGIVSLSRADLAGAPMSALKNDASAEAHLHIVDGEGRKFGAVSRCKSHDGRLTVNVKKFEQTTLELSDWPIDEVMLIVSGRVEITDREGSARLYGAGDSFVMPKGFAGRWRQLSTIEMFTVEHGVWK